MMKTTFEAKKPEPEQLCLNDNNNLSLSIGRNLTAEISSYRLRFQNLTAEICKTVPLLLPQQQHRNRGNSENRGVRLPPPKNSSPRCVVQLEYVLVPYALADFLDGHGAKPANRRKTLSSPATLYSTAIGQSTTTEATVLSDLIRY